MTGDVSVASGVTLTIEPGVVVQGNSWTRQLTVNGSLSAVGTASQHITFTSTSDSAVAQWYRLYFPSGAGASTLDYVDVRYGGGPGASNGNGMVQINGGTISVDHSTFTSSSVSGMAIFGGTTGAGVSVSMKRSKFASNGFSGAYKQGDGLYDFNAYMTVEDSAFWSNALDGIDSEIGSSYAQSTSEISGSSIWNNSRYGVYLWNYNDPAKGADGHISGKPGNAIYDNGTFGFSPTEYWTQLYVAGRSTAVDWSGTYWGPVTRLPCALGSQTGEISFGAPAMDPTGYTPVPRDRSRKAPRSPH